MIGLPTWIKDEIDSALDADEEDDLIVNLCSFEFKTENINIGSAGAEYLVSRNIAGLRVKALQLGIVFDIEISAKYRRKDSVNCPSTIGINSQSCLSVSLLLFSEELPER